MLHAMTRNGSRIVASLTATAPVVALLTLTPPPLRGESLAPQSSVSLATVRSVWTDPGDLPIPAWALSVEVAREDEALYIAPAGTRRATIAAGVRLPLFGALRGPGCTSRWLLVGPVAYVCGDHVTLSAEPPSVPERVHVASVDAMPFRYFFVGRDGAEAYAKPIDADEGSPIEELERGWSVATTGEVKANGRTFMRTRKGRFIDRAQLGPVSPSSFHGAQLTRSDGEAVAIAWVFPDKANVFANPSLGAKVVGLRTRLQQVEVLATTKVGRDAWLRIGGDDKAGAWMRGSDLRTPSAVTAPLPELPEGVGDGERWIDVDTSSQTLTAFEGKKPVFATVVSTGRASSATPKGTFRIWVKLRTATMANADDPGVEADAPLYSIEDVPWVQFFSNGVALHGAFWHRRFGEPHSHGCVNLAPLDAMWLYSWTTPRAPRGWNAAFPTDVESATTVRVR